MTCYGSPRFQLRHLVHSLQSYSYSQLDSILHKLTEAFTPRMDIDDELLGLAEGTSTKRKSKSSSSKSKSSKRKRPAAHE